MKKHPRRAPARRTGVRLAGSVLVGVAVAIGVAAFIGRSIEFDIMAGWTAGAAAFSAAMWFVCGRMDEHETATHAQEEDPSMAGSEVAVLAGTVASLAGVGLLLLAGENKHSGWPDALLGTASVVASWFLVHLTYVLRYARLYYGDGPGAKGIDFEGGEPDYYDFAYVAFDLGMTYQIADTNLKNRQMRRLVLGHMLLSYLLGVGVVATSINLVTSLASS